MASRVTEEGISLKDIDSTQLRRLDLSQLVVFSELMRYRKLTVVAKRIGLSQSAVSHILARLREILGDDLFLRMPHGLEPTARAVELERQVSQIIQISNTIVNRGRAFDPLKEERVLYVAGMDYKLSLFAPRIVDVLRREAPGVRVSFRSSQRQGRS